MTNPNTSLLNMTQAKAGMILSEAILDAHQNVLLPDGTALTDTDIASLNRRGIEQIAVVAEELSAAELQAAREQMQARLGTLFRRSGEHAPEKNLYDSLTRYRLT